MDVTKITKITGTYNNVWPYLFVDKVMGGVNFCLGLIREGDVYVPSSALLEDIRKLTNEPSQVLAIMEKDITSDIYSVVNMLQKDWILIILNCLRKLILWFSWIIMCIKENSFIHHNVTHWNPFARAKILYAKRWFKEEFNFFHQAYERWKSSIANEESYTKKCFAEKVKYQRFL